MTPSRKTPRRTAAPQGQPPEAVVEVRGTEDLGRCVVMLERMFTETEKLDGKDVEVWLRAPGAHRGRPKRVKHLGSGFFVATRTDAYLVTAAHVAQDMDRSARVSFGGPGGRMQTILLSDLVPRRGPVPWAALRHADAAVLRIPRPPHELLGHFLPARLLPTRDGVPDGSLDLTITGFPLGLASERHFAPIAKHAHAASGILRFQGEDMGGPADYFLLDQPSTGGYSGAPVFVAPQIELDDTGRVSLVGPRCVGLVSRTISDESEGQFAAIVPAYVIRRVMARARSA